MGGIFPTPVLEPPASFSASPPRVAVRGVTGGGVYHQRPEGADPGAEPRHASGNNAQDIHSTERNYCSAMSTAQKGIVLMGYVGFDLLLLCKPVMNIYALIDE